jgi:hypothetical protein
MTIDVPEKARLFIAGVNKGDLDTRALANRDGIKEFMERYVTALGQDAGSLYPGPLTDAEIKDAREAVTYLRAQGRQDHEIRAWLIMQQARVQAATRTIDSTHQFDIADGQSNEA